MATADEAMWPWREPVRAKLMAARDNPLIRRVLPWRRIVRLGGQGVNEVVSRYACKM